MKHTSTLYTSHVGLVSADITSRSRTFQRPDGIVYQGVGGNKLLEIIRGSIPKPAGWNFPSMCLKKVSTAGLMLVGCLDEWVSVQTELYLNSKGHKLVGT